MWGGGGGDPGAASSVRSARERLSIYPTEGDWGRKAPNGWRVLSDHEADLQAERAFRLTCNVVLSCPFDSAQGPNGAQGPNDAQGPKGAQGPNGDRWTGLMAVHAP